MITHFTIAVESSVNDLWSIILANIFKKMTIALMKSAGSIIPISV